jgi:2-C-methyl-D-erythritol 4-phosphate cytidylyltransferase
MVSQYGIRKPIRYAPAGRTRQESVLSGLSLVTSPDVIIHEAARPFVKVEDFEEIISCPERNATFGLDIPFTVLRGQDHVEGVLTRSELFNVQLPQKFETSVLKEAHGKALADGMAFTEDASLVFHYFPGTIIHICQGRDYNVKLTTRIDMLAGEIIYDEVFRRRK